MDALVCQTREEILDAICSSNKFVIATTITKLSIRRVINTLVVSIEINAILKLIELVLKVTKLVIKVQEH